MNDKFVYVYINEDELIEEISFDEISSDLKFYKLNRKNSTEIVNLKTEWDKYSVNRRKKHILLETEGSYYIEQITIIYYNDDQIIISPTKNQEYEEDKLLKNGYVKFDELILDFLKGTQGKDIHNYKVEETTPLLSLVKKENIDYLQNIETLNLYKVKEPSKNIQIIMTYDRKKEALNIRSNHKGNHKLFVYFTKCNDATILLKSIECDLNIDQNEIENITLPKQFDMYSPLHDMILFEEI